VVLSSVIQSERKPFNRNKRELRVKANVMGDEVSKNTE